MKNKTIIKTFFAIILTVFTVLSFSTVCYASSSLEELLNNSNERKKLMTTNPFEMAITDIATKVGDYFMEYLTFLFKEEVTIQKIIYNRIDMLNANFFVNGVNPTTSPSSTVIMNSVNQWYYVLQRIVIVLYMMALVVVGLMTMLGRRWWKS